MKKPVINIKGTLILIMLVELAILMVFFTITAKIYYNSYTNVLYGQTEELVDLYINSLENKLKQIEKISFNILSDVNIQHSLKVIEDTEGTYEQYLAANELKESLLYYLFSIEDMKSITFISNAGEQISVGYSADYTYYGPEDIDHITSVAAAQKGGISWLTKSGDDHILLSFRQIRNITGSVFKPYGVLVIKCDMDKIMNPSSSASKEYYPNLLILSNDGSVFSKVYDLNPDAFDASSLKGTSFGFVDIDKKSYFVTEKKSDYIGWTVVSLLNRNYLLYKVQNIFIPIVLAFIAAHLIVIFVGIKLASMISKPVTTLSKLMKNVESGDFKIDENELVMRIKIIEIDQLNYDFKLMINKINHLINDVYTNELTIRDMRYKVLQNKINPHFLYNTLDTVNWMAIEAGNENIAVMVRSLSSMLRDSLKSGDIIALAEETAILRNYIAIQKIRFEERLVFSMEIDEKYHPVLIPKMTLQPIVENSINYGLQVFARPCVIRVKAEEKDGKLRITISDNGEGMSADFIEKLLKGEVEAKKTGLGVKSVNNRIKLAWGEQYGLAINSEEGAGTDVSIILPLDGELKESFQEIWG